MKTVYGGAVYSIRVATAVMGAAQALGSVLLILIKDVREWREDDE